MKPALEDIAKSGEKGNRIFQLGSWRIAEFLGWPSQFFSADAKLKNGNKLTKYTVTNELNLINHQFQIKGK